MSVRGLALLSLVLTAIAVVMLGRIGFPFAFFRDQEAGGFLPWACLAVAAGLALGILVVQGTRDPRLPRRLAALVMAAPVFAVSYALGRILWGKPVSWTHILELSGISFFLFVAFVLALSVLRKM